MCSVVYCNDTECQYYNPNGCTASEIYHSTDRFCITGRRKPKDDTRELMRESEPKGKRKNGKWIGN